MGRAREFAVGVAQRTARRLVIRGGILVLSVGAAVGYRAVTGEELFEQDAATAPAVDSAAADADRGVQLQGEPAAAPAPAAPGGINTTRVAPPMGDAGATAGTAAPAAAAPTAAAAMPEPVQGRIPDLNAPKRAAQRAADATNAATSEKTGQEIPTRAGATPAPAPVAAAAPAPRSGPGSVPAVPQAGPAATEPASTVPQVTREVFSYAAEGRRDPFFSLILTEDLRPLLSDLKLVGILYEASGRRSVAIMRDVLTNAQYRVGSGQTLGRMRVTQIKPKGVIFTIDEFGLSRQDSLVLTDTTKVRIR